MPEITEALTRKIGPLPVWAWGGVVGGGILVARALTGGSGGSGASVSPVALDSAASDVGGAGGASDAAQAALGYITLPNGSVVLDKPPEDVTIIPGGGSTGSTGSVTPTTTPLTLAQKLAAVVKEVIALRRLKPIAEKRWQKLHPQPAHETTTQRYNRLVSERAYLKRATGDTLGYGSMGDTVGVPVVQIPSMPPLPIGNVISLPVYDTPDIYRGPTFARGPIASSARIVMPPVNGGPTGTVVTPILPAASGRAPSASGRRLADPIMGILDRLTPGTPPTTLRPRLRLSTRLRTQALNVSGRNVSG